MRPVNLIPEQDRRGAARAGRTGPLAFIVVGALVLALAGVVVLVTTSNQISDHESDLASLRARTARQTVRAQRLAPFISFHKMREQRTATITELADNRFNWSRVLQELSLVMPRFVVLTEIEGSVGGSGEGESSSQGNSLGGGIPGPSLGISGCAKSQTRTAQFVAALNQIDGVTRVGLAKSTLITTGDESSEAQCPLGWLSLGAVAAFDGAPLPVGASEAAAAETAETIEPESTESESSSEAEPETPASEGTEGTAESGGPTTTETVTTTIPPEG